MSYEFNGMVVPDHMLKAMEDWVAIGRRPGHFLTAVIENDLSAAVAHADASNGPIISAYVGWFYNEAPSSCWGSPSKADAWASRQQALANLNAS